MAGIRPLVCRGFIETDSYRKSYDDLQRRTGLSDREIDDRLESLVWAFFHEPDEDVPLVRRVAQRNLWVAVTDPPYALRVYLRPRAAVAGECEWLWVEERF
jgi:hypothetical protein